MQLIPLFLCLLPLLVASPLQDYRFLDSKSRTPSTNLDIPIKADEADYHFNSFNDPTMFYCEKTMGPLGVNDICTLQQAHMAFSSPIFANNLASKIFPIADRMLFFKDNLVYVHGLQTDFDRPRVQMLAAMSLGTRDDPSAIDNVYFDTVNQYIAVLKGTKLVFYKINGLSLEIKAQVINTPVTSENFQDKKIFYFLDRFVVIFDKATSELLIYSINLDSTLNLQMQVANCQDIYVDSKYVFSFAEQKLKAFNGIEETTVNFAYLVKAVRRGYASSMLVYAENLPNNSPESVIYNIECFGKSGFRLEPLLNIPKGGKTVYNTTKNLFVVYENWLRAYPVIKEKDFNSDFYFDFVISSEISGFLISQGQEFLIVKGNGDQDVKLLAIERSQFGLECKKEKGSEVVEYTFQVRCLGTACAEADSGTQKFANGSCGHTTQIKIYPEEEGGTIGVALLVGLGFIAGIAITMGLGVFNCFGQTSKESVKAHSPRDKRMFGRNRSMRRYTSGSGSNIIETNASLNKVDDSYTSAEDAREQLSISLNAVKKKSSTPVFETPRFTSFGGSNNAGNDAGHSHIGYSHIQSTDQGPESTNEIVKTSGDDETDTLEEKEEGKVKIEKLKLGDNRVVVRDPASFRKELASFRDMVITHVIPEENQRDETDRNTETKYEGKYEAFKDENEEDYEEVDFEDELEEVGGNGHGDSFAG